MGSKSGNLQKIPKECKELIKSRFKPSKKNFDEKFSSFPIFSDKKDQRNSKISHVSVLLWAAKIKIPF